MQKSRLRAAILNAADRNAALVIKNAKIVNVFTEEIIEGDVAMRDGIIIGVGDYSGKAEIDAAQRELGASEGIFAAPEGVANVAALRHLRQNGQIQADEQVVLLNTGSGLKYLA